MFNARIIADSKNLTGQRLTTFIITIPRIVLAEFNTHRIFSRNSASSRAIPFKKMLESVKTNPFIPLAWQKDHSGMQGTEYFSEQQIPMCVAAWLEARDAAVDSAEKMNVGIGITKQVANRILEPWMWQTIIVTSSEWENFFSLRAHEAAEIHIAHIAEMMLEVYNASEPAQLLPGEWHIPYGDQIDENIIYEMFRADNTTPIVSTETHDEAYVDYLNKTKVKIATARCARVSYTVVGEEGKTPDYRKDIELHDRLLSSGHMSPFEHAAQASAFSEWSGNLLGFIQYRKTFVNENRKDNRVIQK